MQASRDKPSQIGVSASHSSPNQSLAEIGLFLGLCGRVLYPPLKH